MRNLDHNAGAPLKPAVAAAMAIGGNASSVHGIGRAARAAIEDARERVAALVGARAGDVVFTSGGTEANNLALRGTGMRRRLASAIEHPSVLRAVPDLEILPCDEDGIVRLEAVDGPALVSVMAANNEVGTVQPIRDIAATVRAHGGLYHCDAVQMAGRLPIDMGELGIDLLTLSAHKLGGPQGVGALVAGPRVGDLAPEMRGGGQERGRRAGTEPVALIAGFGIAATLARHEIDDRARIAALRDRLEAAITDMAPAARVLGRDAPRLPNTTCVTMPGVAAETQVIAFDLAGFAISSGAACSSGKVGPSHVLAAMGVDPCEAATAVRISLGWDTTEDDIGAFTAAWASLYARLGHARAAA
ncbi:MAG: cysteine desulfurase [Alphaproteobacteria bacterium]|nr:cysteine desulfurase [Alphaproteobacteria bacterium]